MKTSRELEAMTWAEFHELFMGKYFPTTARYAKAQEFQELKQGAMTVMEYVACHAPNPRPTRLADPNQVPGRETIYWDSLPNFFFFFF